MSAVEGRTLHATCSRSAILKARRPCKSSALVSYLQRWRKPHLLCWITMKDRPQSARNSSTLWPSRPAWTARAASESSCNRSAGFRRADLPGRKRLPTCSRSLCRHGPDRGTVPTVYGKGGASAGTLLVYRRIGATVRESRQALHDPAEGSRRGDRRGCQGHRAQGSVLPLHAMAAARSLRPGLGRQYSKPHLVGSNCSKFRQGASPSQANSPSRRACAA
ncbi:hypothetical protein QFZ83_002387 [Variovorax sp. W1I1]|nr:hypothetical protein [Variovorax sp. W1I1]